MSLNQLVPLTLALAFTTTVAGTALARRPPALAVRQEEASRVLATCAGSGARSTEGYRDMLARAAPAARLEPTSVATRMLPVLRAMGDHVVLSCPGGRVHAPAGYRDLDRRFRVEQPEAQIASASPGQPNLCVASR